MIADPWPEAQVIDTNRISDVGIAKLCLTTSEEGKPLKRIRLDVICISLCPYNMHRYMLSNATLCCIAFIALTQDSLSLRLAALLFDGRIALASFSAREPKVKMLGFLEHLGVVEDLCFHEASAFSLRNRLLNRHVVCFKEFWVLYGIIGVKELEELLTRA